MTTVEAQNVSAPFADVYDPEAVFSRDSPPLEKVQLKWKPSPSPRMDDPDTTDESTASDSSNLDRARSKRMKPVATQGDAVLLSLLGSGNGNTNDVAQEAARRTLPSDDEEAEVTMNKSSRHHGGREDSDDKRVTQDTALAALAAMETLQKACSTGATMVKEEQTAIDYSRERRQSLFAQGRQDDDKLAPMQTGSPQADKVACPLPSISAHLGPLPNLEQLAEKATAAAKQGITSGHRPSFSSQSPPQPPLFHVRDDNASRGHGSPPSPRTSFRRELPSPGQTGGQVYFQHPRRPSYASEAAAMSYSTPMDYSGSATETPSTDHSTPGSIPAAIDRMSIDGITNPPIGGFVCRFQNCTAQPFQTQYLLNSHANVHSSNRPHYCPVPGCVRSEGGKGFKRKNEMIRHGLVHESPGYVCPYCIDREHKYPRPDNLQRHVRVHHADKDKDDPQLRGVLAQRLEGPSRGRRRRGDTN